MGKHVCPVCEDIYAVKASVDVKQGDRSDVAEGWGCPACGYFFVGLADLEGLLRWAADSVGDGAPSATAHLLGSAIVTRRMDSRTVEAPGLALL
jgi:hypothetical protein